MGRYGPRVADLANFVADALARLPTEENQNLTLTAETIGAPPPELETERLLLKGSFPGRVIHPSNTRLDLVDFFADRPTYRALGLLIFATIFHQTRVQLHLDCSEGTHLNGVSITDLVIDSRRDQEEPYADELVVRPFSYGYWPVPSRERHPLYEPTLNQREMPWIIWSNEQDMVITEQEWQRRSFVYGFGEMFAAARLAGLFLDIGLPGSQSTEFVLEGPTTGTQSLSAMSAEARIWVGYDYSP